ncbi:hypothetical protein [Streptomyces caelestis]|uniref:hypothetical protein n=1 Tax=Streptomyces caelestis TaxID=36816 RepID=UPI0036559941
MRLLDAACEQLCRRGIKRSTMAAAARLAKEVLVEQVVRREFRRYFDRFAVEVQGRDGRRPSPPGFLSSLRALRRNRLIGGRMAVEPDAVPPSMTSDGGRALCVAQRFVADRLRREQQADHVIADVNVDVVPSPTSPPRHAVP